MKILNRIVRTQHRCDELAELATLLARHARLARRSPRPYNRSQIHRISRAITSVQRAIATMTTKEV